VAAGNIRILAIPGYVQDEMDNLLKKAKGYEKNSAAYTFFQFSRICIHPSYWSNPWLKVWQSI
jgi:hypothetical protein